ncbi:MAG: hypothetical protein EXR36_00650 [Betaproteobacteria bacterium]|nr:hypothetical protein [Betaproteobacteria bacterium]
MAVALAFCAISPWAASQTNRASVGDLVELTTGMGPTLAEVIAEPDAPGYVLLLIPSGKQVPVNTQKLRLVQKAGTPNAPIKIGEPVSWVDGNFKESGNVVKVNGNWRQVKTPSATTIGWIECNALLGAAQPARKKDKSVSASNAPSEKPPAVKLQGNWENAYGTVKL